MITPALATSRPAPVHLIGQALVANHNDGTLLVRPAGQRSFRLPGAVVKAGEMDWEAAVGAVRAEIGLRVRVHRLVAKDWIPEDRGTGAPARLYLVYYCGRQPDHAPLRPQATGVCGTLPRLADAQWVSTPTLAAHCFPGLTRRIEAARWAARSGTFAELAEGRHLHEEP